jgi:hypothetical protein
MAATNQKNEYLPNLPSFLLEKGRSKHEEARVRYEQAKKRISKEYHDFLVLLDQSIKISPKKYALESEAIKLNMWVSDKGTYVSIQLPYMTVDGRVTMAREEHKKSEKKLCIHPPVISENGKSIVVTIESELLGTASGSSVINVGGNGVDRTNPLENAESSAIGRALGFLGYGMIGTGIASADEVQMAQNRYPADPGELKQSTHDEKDEKQGKVINMPPPPKENPLSLNCELVDMRPDVSSDESEYWEIIFKKEGKEAKVYAVGDMFKKVSTMDLAQGKIYKIMTEKAENGLFLLTDISPWEG